MAINSSFEKISKSLENADIGDQLVKAEYQRMRLTPKLDDALYLHLSDLRLALESYATNEALRVLDFGCGCSPYRSLFPCADYRRTDYLNMEGMDYRIGEDERVPEEDSSFDIVLSTQVLEHVSKPKLYLEEAWRLLKPGGRLILTTHGVFAEHGCPFDFHRWTADGLCAEVEAADLTVNKISKLTVNGRAIAFLLDQMGTEVFGSRGERFGFLFWFMNRQLYKRRSDFHRWCDIYQAANRIVDGHIPGALLYIGLLVEAKKAGGAISV
ncbi:MAG: class I SAM-dependent methyltransferase [Chthoniobacteraceae bacterium]